MYAGVDWREKSEARAIETRGRSARALSRALTWPTEMPVDVPCTTVAPARRPVPADVPKKSGSAVFVQLATPAVNETTSFSLAFSAPIVSAFVPCTTGSSETQRRTTND